MKLTIGNFVRNNTVGPLVGVEVEVEGTNLPARLRHWSIVHEGSLRPVDGSPGVEYIFPRPLAYHDALNALEELEAALERANPQWSDRTSVHVHVNSADLTVEQWYTMLFLWVLFEEPLLDFCGENRRGNLFCLSSRDAEALLFTLESVARTGRIEHIDDNVRYAAVNVNATRKYGSTEFRSMRGCIDMPVLDTWLKTLLTLREKAIEIGSPSALLDRVFSTPNFASTIFEPHHFIHSYEGLQRSVEYNAYRCSLIVEGTDWSNFEIFDEPAFDI